MTRSRRKPRPEAPDPQAVLARDRLRGALWGALLGGGLGAGAEGLDRDAILLAHGRIVRRDPARPTPGVFATRLLAEALASPRDRSASARLAAALGRAWATASGGAPSASELARLPAVLELALETPPYRRLDARAVLARLEASTAPEPLARALGALRDQLLAPPAPKLAVAPYGALSPGLRAALLAVQALLVRPGSSEEAIVYAVNLGGEPELQGGLAGVLAGAHRGAASLPERWFLATDPQPDVEAALQALLAPQL